MGVALIVASTLLMAIPLAGATGALVLRSGSGTSAASSAEAASAFCGVGTTPHYPAYDPVNHDVYVPNVNSDNVTVLSGCKVVATVGLPSGSGPWAAAFDPVNDYIYVTDVEGNSVSVISGKSLVTTFSDPSFDEPNAIAFEPDVFSMVVANSGTDTISYLDIDTFGVSQVVTVGDNPDGLQWVAGDLFVASYGSASLSIVNEGAVRGTVPVGTQPEGIAFDWATQTLDVVNYGSDNVTAFCLSCIGGFTGTSIPVGSHPTGIVWDQSKLEVYVADQGSSYISVIKGYSVVRTIEGTSGTGLTGLAYDDATDMVYATAINTNEVFEYS